LSAFDRVRAPQQIVTPTERSIFNCHPHKKAKLFEMPPPPPTPLFLLKIYCAEPTDAAIFRMFLLLRPPKGGIDLVTNRAGCHLVGVSKVSQARLEAWLGVHVGAVCGLFVVSVFCAGLLRGSRGTFGACTRPRRSRMRCAHPRWAESPHER